MSLLMLTLLVLLLALPGGLAQRAQHAAATACSRQHSAWLSELRPSESGVELELTALAGMNLASWSLVGYDSRSGSCGSCLQMDVFLFTRTTVVPNQEATGLGTLHLVGAASTDGPGPIDAIALLDGVSGTVVELVSWGGSSFVAADGPADGPPSISGRSQLLPPYAAASRTPAVGVVAARLKPLTAVSIPARQGRAACCCVITM